MYPMIWIAMVIAATLVTLLCGGYSIESVENALLYRSVSTKRAAILWTAGAIVSLLCLLLIIFTA